MAPRRPLASCPRCNSSAISAERIRHLHGALMEAYVRCPKCHHEQRTRLTTEPIERERAALDRWRRIRRRTGGGRVSSEQVRIQFVRLRNAALREGLTDEVPELCQPPSESH